MTTNLRNFRAASGLERGSRAALDWSRLAASIKRKSDCFATAIQHTVDSLSYASLVSHARPKGTEVIAANRFDTATFLGGNLLRPPPSLRLRVSLRSLPERCCGTKQTV
jgi:hypothetical protein